MTNALEYIERKQSLDGVVPVSSHDMQMRYKGDAVIKKVALLLLIYFLYSSHYLWGFCVGLCLSMHYSVSFIVLAIIFTRKRERERERERESWLFCFYCLSYGLLLLMFCGSSSRHRNIVYSL